MSTQEETKVENKVETKVPGSADDLNSSVANKDDDNNERKQEDGKKTTTSTSSNDTTTTTTAATPNSDRPSKVFGTEAALEELARQEFESQRALASVERAMDMQQQLSNCYGWDAEASRVVATLEAQRNVQQMKMTNLAIQRQRLMRGMSGNDMPYSTQTLGMMSNSMSGGLGYGMSGRNYGDTNFSLTNSGNNGNNAMNRFNNPMTMSPVMSGGVFNSSVNSGSMSTAGGFGANMKIQQLKMMEQEQMNVSILVGYERERVLKLH
jgi:hypothetical protein